jgi:hypothetical protein
MHEDCAQFEPLQAAGWNQRASTIACAHIASTRIPRGSTTISRLKQMPRECN